MTTEVTSGSGCGQELQIISNDVGSIQDEDVLRRMWQQTEDFSRKKEIRARMYKLREQRLKDFYTTGEVLRDLQTVGDGSQQIIATATTKKSATTVSSMSDSGEVRTHGSHAESIHGQGGGFMSLKSKEIRDSESPTRDLHRRQQLHQDFSAGSQGGVSETSGSWKVVRESSASAYDSSNDLGVVSTSSRTEQRGTTQGNLASQGVPQGAPPGVPQGVPQAMQLVDAGETVIHNPDGSITRRQSATYKSSSSSTSASQLAASQRTVSSSTASSRIVTTAKSSTTASSTSDQPGVVITEITGGSNEKRGSIIGDAALKTTSTSTSSRSEQKQQHHQQQQQQQQQQSGVDQRIMTEISKLDSYLSTHNATGSTNTPVSPRSVCSEAPVMPQQAKGEFVFETSSTATNTAAATTAASVQESKRVTSTSSTTKTSATSNDLDATRQAKYAVTTSSTTTAATPTPAIEDSDRRQSTTVIEQRTTTTRLENEKRAADVSSSKQQTTTEPSTTVVTTATTTTKRDQQQQQQQQQRPRPREVDADQYVTTYQQSYNSKRISEDLSPTHQYFASALRASPAPSSARATPTRSLDRESSQVSSRPSSRPSSPRKSSRGGTPDSSRASPAKDRPRVASPIKSTTTTTTFDSSTIRRSSAASKDKRRFTSSASRAAAKKRSGTPGASPRASPRTSPVRARSASPTSSTAEDSDAFTTSGRRRSNSKTSVSSSATWTRDLTRKSSSETLKGGSTSKEASPLRDDVTPKVSPQPTPTAAPAPYRTPNAREKSPEYSSDGSLASELFQRAERGERRTDKDASPDRFTPIKAFRTIPEGDILEPKKPADTDATSSSQTTRLTTKTQIDSAAFLREETRRTGQPSSPRPASSSVSPCTSPERSPVRPALAGPARGPAKAPQPARSPASSPERSPERKPSPASQPAGRKPAGRVPSIPRTTAAAGKPSQPQRPRDTSAPATPTRKVPGQRRSSSSSPERPKQQARLTPKRPVESRTPTAPATKRPLADKTNLRSPAGASAAPAPARPTKPAQQPSKSAFVRTGSRPEADTKPRTPARTPSSHRLTAEVCGACHLKLGAEKDTVQCTAECKRKFHVRCVASGEEIKLIKLRKNWRCVRCGGEATTRTTTTVTTKTTVTKTLGRQRSTDGGQRRPASSAVPADSGAESDRSSSVSPPTVRPAGRGPGQAPSPTRPGDVKTTTSKESRDRIDLASLCGVVIEDGKEINVISTGDYYSDLENEAPPEEFLVDDDEDLLEQDRKARTKTSTRTTVTTKRNEQNDTFLESERRSQAQQRSSKDLFSRTGSDRSVLKKQTAPGPGPGAATPKRQTSKPELTTGGVPTSTAPGGRPYSGAVLEVCGVCHLKLGAEKDTVQCTAECKRKFHVRCVASGDEIKLIKLRKNWRCVRCGGEATDKKTIEKENSRGKLTVKVDKTVTGKVDGAERRGSTTTSTITTSSSTRQTKLLTNGQRREESFTSGDETDVPNADKTATPTGVDSYMWELEDMRRRQEEQYARKVTDKENILLNADVHVQLPKSSRESSPDARGAPGRAGSVCTAGDESDSSRPRYADRVSEPGSDEEGPGPRQGSVNKLPQLDERRSSEQRELERDQDGLEGDENDVANLSVSDKVNRFMESSRTLSISELKTAHRPSSAGTSDQPGNVSKAKALFENIASGQQGHTHSQEDDEEREQHQQQQSSSEVVTTVTSTVTAPQQIDVMSRPSIFEGRKVLAETTIETTTKTVTAPELPPGVTIAKDTLPRKRSPSPEPPSFGLDFNKKPEPAAKQPTPARAHATPTQPDSSFRDSKMATTSKKTDTTSSTRRDSVRRELFPDSKKTTTTTTSEKSGASTSFLDSERSTSALQRTDTAATTSSRTTSPVKDVSRKDSNTSLKDLTKRGSSSSIKEVTRKDSSTSLKDITKRESSASLKDITRKESSSSISRRESSSSITRKDSSSSVTRKDTTSPTKDVTKKSTPARSPSPTGKPKQMDILSRPSIFEGRKILAAKEGATSSTVTTTTTTSSATRTEPRSPTKDAPSPSPSPSAPSFSFMDRPTESSLARVNKFGVHLRSTASSSATSTAREQRRPSAVFVDGQELNIEEVFDIEFLETILERVVGYEQRRRIRTQIRKAREQAESLDVKTSTKTSSSRSQAGNTTTEKVTTTTTSQSPTSKIITTKVTTRSSTASGSRKSPEKVSPATSPSRSSPARSSPTRSSPERSPSRSPDRVATRKSSASKSREITERRRSSASSTVTSSSTMRASTSSRTESSSDKVKSTASLGRLAGREAAREACPTDSITSSYGVGPTDDRGRPLFGLKALRRTNTNRTLPDPEPSADTSTKQSTSSTSNYTSRISSTVTGASSRPRAADITDSSGLPLFGGLRALKVNSTTSSSSTTIEQSARESPAQLRDRSVQDDKAPVLDRADSFRSTISVQLSPSVGDSRKFSFEKSAEQTGGGERSSPVSRRKLSDDSRSSSSSSVLRSLIEKHENISSSGDALLDSSRRGILKKARDEPGAASTTATSSSYSRSTVVSRRQVVGPDGSVSLTRDVIRGETVSKAGQEPVTNVTREHFAYETPRPRDEPSALTITQLDSGDEGRGSRKSSPSPDRVLIESAQSSKRSSRNFDEDTKYSSSFRRSSAQDDFIQTEKKHSTLTSQNGDELGDCGSRLYSSKVVGDSPNKWSSTVTSKKTDGDATTHTTTTTSKERRSSGGVTSESTSVSSKSITTSKSTSPSRKSPTRDASKKQSSEKWSSGSNSESKTTSRFSSSSRTSTSRNSSSNIERRRSSATADDVSEEGSSTVTSSLLRTSQRGSVRALQEKFQKAAGSFWDP